MKKEGLEGKSGYGNVCGQQRGLDRAMLEVSGIRKRYGRKIVLDGVSFQAECGESVAVIGRNGCGKTTLMQILAGVMKPDGGSLRYFGNDPQGRREYFHKYCGYVPQELPLMEELSVRDNLRLWGVGRLRDSAEMIREFQLEELMKTTVSKLSGGMKRRLCIACALSGRQPILLMDEPTTALDLYYKDVIGAFMKQYCAKNGIIVMTTHDEREILSCDRCLLMQEGHMAELAKEERDMDSIRKILAG